MTIDEKTFEAWDNASYMAMEGDNKLLANFLRANPVPHPEIDIDLVRIADLLDGRLKRPRRRPTEDERKTRARDPYLLAADGDVASLLAMLERAHVESYAEIPDYRLLAEVVRGDHARSRGPYPGHQIEQGLDALDIVRRVRQMQFRMKRERNNGSLDLAWLEVAGEMFKSKEWVRERYYRMNSHSGGPIEVAHQIRGVEFIDDHESDLPDAPVTDTVPKGSSAR